MSDREQTPDGYLHDVFISYAPVDPVKPWLERHFVPLLKKWLGVKTRLRGAGPVVEPGAEGVRDDVD